MTWRAMWECEAFPGVDYADFATEAEAHRRAFEVVRETGQPVKVFEIENGETP